MHLCSGGRGPRSKQVPASSITHQPTAHAHPAHPAHPPPFPSPPRPQAGPAWSSDLLPDSRRAHINPARNSQLYFKEMIPVENATFTRPGKRIGF